MTKPKHFSNEADVLYLRENIPWIEGEQCLISNGILPLRDFGKE